MNIDFSAASWMNKPNKFDITENTVTITTDPNTDFWQRTFYGFRNDNAPALLLESSQNFTFTVRTTFNYKALFDQCGLIIYLDSENWFKASIENENEQISRLGSVVTNLGYSDWATTDIAPTTIMWYRLSRRGPDFLIESSTDGSTFNQMRVFHLHNLGPTTPEMGKANPPQPPTQPIQFGLYACSPLDSSFTVTFDNISIEPCQWLAHYVE
ncbi:MAG: DUF1349 domain-containing protein [Chloroflexi bacterium]|nr:MAG: DUF1349 domain-containing protein [Chloroflexota bacterium]